MQKKVGLGLRSTFQNDVLQNPTDIPWFEIITENFLSFGGKPKSNLRHIRSHYPIAFHGVSLSIGSIEPLRKEYLQKLKAFVDEIQPLWVSDHLCWTYQGAENSHDLLPLPFTKTSLQRVISKTLQVQDFLGRQIFLENPSAYIQFSNDEYSESEFIKEFCLRSGCGLLLDLNNIVVNHYNLGLDPLSYLETIRSCPVQQMHLAGHTVKEKVRIDTHDAPVNAETLHLLNVAMKIWPHANPMIEWDDKIPTLQELLQERRKLQTQVDSPVENEFHFNSIHESKHTSNFSDIQGMNQFWSVLKQDQLVTAETVADFPISKSDRPTPAEIGLRVYNSAYKSRLIEVLQKDFPVLNTLLDEYFPDVGLAYLKKHPSTFDSIDFAGTALPHFLRTQKLDWDLGVDQKILADVAEFEIAIAHASIAIDETWAPAQITAFTATDFENKLLRLTSSCYVMKASCEIHPVIQAVQNQQIPEVPDWKETGYVFHREDNHVSYEIIDSSEAEFLQELQKSQPFLQTFAYLDTQEAIQKAAACLVKHEKWLRTPP